MNSYIELCIHIDGGDNVYLRVPTVWDEVEQQWIGFIKTPITKKVIHGQGKTSKDLENSFITALSKCMNGNAKLSKEIFEMFMPAFYWEKVGDGHD